MIVEHKPIKRSKELASLSREHHDGLLFTWKIKQGIANEVHPKRIAGFCMWFWQEHLKAHTEKEERLLTEILASEHPAMTKMIDEHEAIINLIYSLQEYACYERLQRLMTILNYHIRFEERQLFRLIEQVATPSLLQKIEKELEASNEATGVWTDEFWLPKITSVQQS